jgi:ketosteroid isomerase-like protein
MDEHTEIAESRAAFADALERGDPAGASALYADDAKLLPPSAGVIEGRAAIEAFWRAGIDVGISQADFETFDFHRHDGLAYEIGRYALRLKPAHGGTVVDRGKYLLIHERQSDGSWRRAAEMFHPDDPSTGSREGGDS